MLIITINKQKIYDKIDGNIYTHITTWVKRSEYTFFFINLPTNRLRMEKLDEFDIPFIGLKNGIHQFVFILDNTFFECYDFNDFHKAAFKVELELHKSENFLELEFTSKGNVSVSCDVTTEHFDLVLNSSWSQIIKFGNPEASTDEILVLPVGAHMFNVSQQIYEMIVLEIPLKLEHPGIADGTLQSEILDKLKTLEPRETPIEGHNDPRWDKLKDLL